MSGKKRCDWCEGDQIYIEYHDQEWGVPIYSDQIHFEFLVLESMQAGLSWLTILKKRENFRAAFDGFDYRRVALYGEDKIESLLKDPGIIRHRGKIEAAINNASKFMDIQEEFGSFNTYIWSFVDNKTIVNNYHRVEEVPTKSKVSERISKDLKARGFKFLGPVIIYSYLQAVGIIDDHINTCFKRMEK